MLTFLISPHLGRRLSSLPPSHRCLLLSLVSSSGVQQRGASSQSSYLHFLKFYPQLVSFVPRYLGILSLVVTTYVVPFTTCRENIFKSSQVTSAAQSKSVAQSRSRKSSLAARSSISPKNQDLAKKEIELKTKSTDTPSNDRSNASRDTDDTGSKELKESKDSDLKYSYD